MLERCCAGSQVELLLHVSPASTPHGCGLLCILKQQEKAIAQISDILFLESEARDSIDDAFAGATSGRGDDGDSAGLGLENDDWEALCIAIVCRDTG